MITLIQFPFSKLDTSVIFSHMICFFIIFICILLSLFVILYYRYRHKRLLQQLDHMLDCAIQGNFTEQHFDESMLSRVETRFVEYLNNSCVSERNLTDEKNHIKELISDISHQTKTPIANLLLYTQLLSERFEGCDIHSTDYHTMVTDCRQYITALTTQAEKLNFLVGALVKTSRLETGILSLHPVSHPIAPMITDAIAQLTTKADAKQIRLICKNTTDISAFYDKTWTTEALCNIIDNAIKYTPSEGTIQIQVSAYELFCRIDITDNGMGIAEEEHGKIFTRFYRSPLVSDTEGVGIGLYLTRQIISEQGGYLRLCSAPSQGSTFSVFLPLDIGHHV